MFEKQSKTETYETSLPTMLQDSEAKFSERFISPKAKTLLASLVAFSSLAAASTAEAQSFEEYRGTVKSADGQIIYESNEPAPPTVELMRMQCAGFEFYQKHPELQRSSTPGDVTSFIVTPDGNRTIASYARKVDEQSGNTIEIFSRVNCDVDPE